MQRHEAQAPTAPFNEWPPRRIMQRNTTQLHVTPVGLEIGRSYVPPPAPMGSEAVRIQAAFLPPAPRSIDGKVALIAAWLGVFALLAVSRGWF